MPEEKKDEQPGRSVRIVVGKKKYAVYTRLDEETCASVVSLVQGLVEKMPFSISQEEKLLLACLRLAFSVHHSAQLLGGVFKHIPEGDGRTGSPGKSLSSRRRGDGNVSGELHADDVIAAGGSAENSHVPPSFPGVSGTAGRDGGDKPEGGG
jgi:hypothetical protein